jgi:hypothetical protein
VFVVSKTFCGLRGAVERAVRLGQSIVHEKIGDGAMGALYRASHAMLSGQLRSSSSRPVDPEKRPRRASSAR